MLIQFRFYKIESYFFYDEKKLIINVQQYNKDFDFINLH